MNEQIKQKITNDALATLNRYDTIIFISVLIIIPMLICAILHYIVLHKLLNKKYTFGSLMPAKKNGAYSFGFYGIMTVLTGIVILILSKTVKYFSTDLKKILEMLDQGNWVLLYVELITIILLIFSPYFFAKPVKETWKAILLAGIIAGAIAYGFEEYFARNFFAMK